MCQRHVKELSIARLSKTCEDGKRISRFGLCHDTGYMTYMGIYLI